MQDERQRATDPPGEALESTVYGYDDQRTRYLPTKVVRPPFGGSEWSFNAGKLLDARE